MGTCVIMCGIFCVVATVEEIEAEDHIKRQLQTQALHFKVDVSELSADIVIDFSMISPGSYGTVYVSNVFATSSAVYCGSISAKGRLFLNVNSMLPYSSTSGVLYITVTGTSGAEFEVFVESSVSVGKCINYTCAIVCHDNYILITVVRRFRLFK